MGSALWITEKAKMLLQCSLLDFSLLSMIYFELKVDRKYDIFLGRVKSLIERKNSTGIRNACQLMCQGV